MNDKDKTKNDEAFNLKLDSKEIIDVVTTIQTLEEHE